ncbi:unnamed protein product [Ambrosiozyma monospora]|uniref:Unnamed protein product n=1 Tax=Ambrosiozyma monospora TaxID=43982 RepID=A0ACB5TYU4_AMBMO|nr:unnamed protein product [Ambrosiozyma monospora]
MNNRYREVSRPTLEYIKERLEAKKSKDVNNKMSTLTAALSHQTQQAQMMNPTLPYQPSPAASVHASSTNLFQLHQSHLQQQQPLSQSLMLTQSQSQSQQGVTASNITPDLNEEKKREEDLTVDDYWIEYLIRQQLNEKPEFKFKGTVLIDYVPKDKLPQKKLKPCHDFLVVGPTPEKLMDYMPYVKPEDEDSSSDEEFDYENSIVSCWTR